MELQLCQDLQQAINSKNLQQAMMISQQMMSNNTKVLVTYRGQVVAGPGLQNYGLTQTNPVLMQSSNMNTTHLANTLGQVPYGQIPLNQYGTNNPITSMNPIYYQNSGQYVNNPSPMNPGQTTPSNLNQVSFPVINRGYRTNIPNNSTFYQKY